MNKRNSSAISLGLAFTALSISLACYTSSVRADEGMFPFNTPPKEQLAQKYHFDLNQEWLDKAMHAAVRFNNGGSGGFISPDGLVITNHHIADATLSELSTPQNDLIARGFLARTRSEELKAPNLELNCLQSIEDVTSQVQAGITSSMDPQKAADIRRGNISEIEKKATQKTGLRCDVVTLYQGSRYHLYSYKKYTDVRLVWAPEEGVAFFGGDADNFEYPRTCLDAAIFRVYENGKPVQPQSYFPMSFEGVKEGELVFVIGHPGTTNRLETYAQVEHTRNFTLPYRLAKARAMENAYHQFAERSTENARRINNDIRSVANSRKAYTGMYEGLCQEAIMKRKADQENKLREGASSQNPWKAVESAINNDKVEENYYLFERCDAYPSPLFHIARHIVRLAQAKDNSKYELPEYRANKLDSLKADIFSPAPIYADVEKARLGASLSFLGERCGPDRADAHSVLHGLSPQDRAQQLVEGTRLFDVDERRRLASLSLEDLKKSDDAMIQLALEVDPIAREARSVYEDKVRSPLIQSYSQIAQERFRQEGMQVPPDATFTLRLSYGVVKSYEDNGQKVPYMTTLGDFYGRAQQHKNAAPYQLPKSWELSATRVQSDIPMVFISTADTIGGNSGSPVLNTRGEMVGLNFDRNQFGMVRNYVYDETKARHISVATPGLLEALDIVYNAQELLAELKAASASSTKP